MQLSFDNINVEHVPLLSKNGVETSVLRLDKLHPVISGNKWFKLRYYLEDALILKSRRVVTFGGYYSNHLVATAGACKMLGLRSGAIIRGERPPSLSATLREAESYGMQLHFQSRDDYRRRIIPEEWNTGDTYVIDQGGYGVKGVEGAATILDFAPGDFTHFGCAVGTGTMMAGIVRAARLQQHIVGISAMKNNVELNEVVARLNEGAEKQWDIIHDYHFGGFAKKTPELIAFMNDFYRHTGIPSDFVYTGKLFYAVHELLEQDFFPRGSRLLLIHSGGLQGNNSLQKGTLIF